MGIFSNSFLAGMVHRHNHRRNGISRQLFGFIPDSGNVVLCGGDTTSNDSFAAELKKYSLIDSIIQAAKDKRPALCIYSNDSLTPEIMGLLEDNKLKDRICFFGHTHSYIPFDKNVDHYKAEQMMGKLIDSYNHRKNLYDSSIQTTMSMLLNILDNCLPSDYFTFTNLEKIVLHLVRTGNSNDNGYGFTGEQEFLNWLKSETGADLDFYENQLTINWNTAITAFFISGKKLLRK